MKKFLIVLLSIILVFTLGACSNTQNTAEDKNNEEKEDEVVEPAKDIDENNEEQPEEKVEEEIENEIVEPTPETNEKEVTLYFVNKDYIETGNEDLEKLIGEKRVIKFDGISLEEAIVTELIEGTEDPKLSTVIPSNVQLINVEVSDKTAFVNFAQEGLFGGSMQETFTLSQIIKSLTELDTVDKVQFLIDGKKADSLMGHYDISQPFESPVH